MLIQLSIVYEQFCTTMAKWIVFTENIELTKSEVFPISWPVTEKNIDLSSG